MYHLLKDIFIIIKNLFDVNGGQSSKRLRNLNENGTINKYK